MLKKLLSVEIFKEQVCYCPLKRINQTIYGYILGVHIVINDKSILKKHSIICLHYSDNCNIHNMYYLYVKIEQLTELMTIQSKVSSLLYDQSIISYYDHIFHTQNYCQFHCFKHNLLRTTYYLMIRSI